MEFCFVLLLFMSVCVDCIMKIYSYKNVFTLQSIEIPSEGRAGSTWSLQGWTGSCRDESSLSVCAQLFLVLRTVRSMFSPEHTVLQVSRSGSAPSICVIDSENRYRVRPENKGITSPTERSREVFVPGRPQTCLGL